MPNGEWVLPIVDQDRCTGCGLCERLCPTEAVKVLSQRAVIVRPEACSFCDRCETYCPTGAIGRPFTIVFEPDVRPATPAGTGSPPESGA